MAWVSVKQHPRSLSLVLTVLLLLAHAPSLTIKEWQPTTNGRWTQLARQAPCLHCNRAPGIATAALLMHSKKVAQTWRSSRSLKLQVQHCVTVTHRVQTKPKGRQYPAGPAASTAGHTRHASHKPPSVRHQTNTDTRLYLAVRSLRHTHAFLLAQSSTGRKQ